MRVSSSNEFPSFNFVKSNLFSIESNARVTANVQQDKRASKALASSVAAAIAIADQMKRATTTTVRIPATKTCADQTRCANWKIT